MPLDEAGMARNPQIDRHCACQHGPCAGARAAVLAPWFLLWAAAEHQHGPCSGTRAAVLVPWFFVLDLFYAPTRAVCRSTAGRVCPQTCNFSSLSCSSLVLGHSKCFVQTCNLYTTKQTA